MTMHKALHPRDDVDTLYESRKEGGRGLARVQDSVDASIQWLEDYIRKDGGRLITVTGNNTDNTSINRIKNYQKAKIERKTTVWAFQAANKWNLSRENLDMA